MYINVTLAHSLSWNLREIIYMQLLKQNKIEDLHNELAMYATDEILERFEKEGIITKVKKKKKDDCDFSIMRLSKKGVDILENIEVPEVTEGDLQMYNFLKDIYMSHEDAENRSLGNQKKTKTYVAILRNHLGMTLHQFYWLCWLFLDKYPYTRRLENIFLDPNKVRYGRLQNNLDSSSLYQWYNEHMEEVQQFFKTKGV